MLRSEKYGTLDWHSDEEMLCAAGVTGRRRAALRMPISRSAQASTARLKGSAGTDRCWTASGTSQPLVKEGYIELGLIIALDGVEALSVATPSSILFRPSEGDVKMMLVGVEEPDAASWSSEYVVDVQEAPLEPGVDRPLRGMEAIETRI